MDFNRFGRLNSKKIEYFINECGDLLDMEYLFPYLTTRSKNMKQRHTIIAFKKMIKKYRYCYSLDKNCVAFIKRKGDIEESICHDIDNNLYVFTDIPDYNIDLKNCVLVYDAADIIPIKNESFELSYITTSVLKNMQNRKISPFQYQLLEEYVNKIDFVSLHSEYLNINDLDESIFNEFVWRMVLLDKQIYKSDKTHEVELKSKRTKVEEPHSILKYYDKHNTLDYIRVFFNKLDDTLNLNQYKSSNKLIYEYLQKFYGTYFFNNLDSNSFINDIRRVYINSIEYLLGVKSTYIFLENPYSKGYRSYFAKRRKLYSLFNTQQIMRKLKREYKLLDEIIRTLKNELKSINSKFDEIKNVITQYENSLGDNNLPNKGFGYLNDSWNDDEDIDDVSTQIRMEMEWELEQERMLREQYETEASFYDNDESELEELEYQKYLEEESKKRATIEMLVQDNRPLEVFKTDSKLYFEYYDEISIKDAFEITNYNLLDNDISLSGVFKNFEEYDNWIETNTDTIPF